MTTIRDFIKWAGSQSRAAQMAGVSGAHMSRLASGSRGVTPTVALRIERASFGRFRKEALLWPVDNAS
ncbi:YdaS family helix-turn-helix protein [Silanimonas sp.]|jgi:DNA-binding transcriptional regulator YdaS (Cro superfamily)|uniref:YdaS family helix-turn-helix protein n=1 Tax=Silanimonas sp. TaxID=1929290 RepID=UPI0022BDE752|nr:YdaS family helix-turn-helix protein [Silanimonas sp.]MCZ8113844.1 YdaS family helix-turn-helix protein [Silanimonas sp.]